VSEVKLDETVLYCRDSATNTDKEYRAVLMSKDGAYLVFFMWGRRGKNLQKGDPKVYSNEARARVAMEEQLRVKRKKGYRSSPEDRQKEIAASMRAAATAVSEANAREARGEKRWPTMPDKPRRVVRRYPIAKPKPKPPAILGGTRRIKLDD
jgi:predicted DNA-binding WGR domain protein